MSDAEDLLGYLYKQIDPLDRGNPKYDLLHRQIARVHEALAAIAKASPSPPIKVVLVRDDAVVTLQNGDRFEVRPDPDYEFTIHLL